MSSVTEASTSALGKQECAAGHRTGGLRSIRNLLAKKNREAALLSRPLGLGMLSSYLDDLRLDIAVVGFLAAWLSSFTLALALDNSARTAVAIFAESILYRAAVRARSESFASDCLGL